MVEIEEVAAAEAGAALARAGVRDPRGANSPQDIARHAAVCLRVRVPDLGEAVLALRVEDGTLWADGAASDDGAGLTPVLAEILTGAARRAGCARVRMETDRRAYLRIARRLGWRVCAVLPLKRSAYIIEKDVQ